MNSDDERFVELAVRVLICVYIGIVLLGAGIAWL